MLDADAIINNSSEKVGGSNAYPNSAPKKVGGSGPRKTHRIYAPANRPFGHQRRYMKSLRIARKARPRAAGRDNGHVIVIIGLGNTSDLVDMIVVSPLAEVIEEVRQRRVRCQRRHVVVNDEAPSGDYWRRSGSHPELRYTMTCH